MSHAFVGMQAHLDHLEQMLKYFFSGFLRNGKLNLNVERIGFLFV